MDRLNEVEFIDYCEKRGVIYTGCVHRKSNKKSCIDFCEAIKRSNVNNALKNNEEGEK